MDRFRMRLWLCAVAAMFAPVLGWAGASPAQEVTLTPQDGLERLSKMAPQLKPGTTVVLKAGVYHGNATLNGVHGAPGRPVVITGEKGTVIDSWKDKAKKEFLPTSSLQVGNSNDVEIRNLEITGAARGVTLGACSNVKLVKNSIHDVASYGIMNYMSSGTTIEGNLIERSVTEHGIYVSGNATGIRVSGNTVRDTHINGIHCNGAIAGPVIENNVLERTGVYPAKEGGAAITLIGGVTAPVVRGNTFKGIHGQGITIDAPGGTISANKFESYSWSGVLVLPGARDLTLTGNQFQDPACIPLQIAGPVIASLKASKNTYAIKGGKVCQDTKTEKVLTLDQWKAMGKDAS